jgi:hypothetical protein
MTISKIRFNFYRENILNTFAGFTSSKTITIHQVINSKVGYDPFHMKTKGTKRHNSINRLGLMVSNYNKGYVCRDEFIAKLLADKHLAKYAKCFK